MSAMLNPAESAPRKILIAYDESEVGRQVLEWVNSHSVLLPNDEVVVATAVNEDISKLTGPGVGWQASPALGENIEVDIKILEDQAKERLTEAVYAIRDSGVKNVKGELLRGHAKEVLVKYANDTKSDIVICGNRGQGYLTRKLTG
ncbi:hypothetical protein K501DRAFT_225430, partial [Backusella circina FSU 941]